MKGNKMSNSCSIHIPISLGELIDKITILKIKKKYIQEDKLANIKKELSSLEEILKEKKLNINTNLINQLEEVNFSLWKIEDKIRFKESRKEFDNEFIHLARSVYMENDRRAAIKYEINSTYNSDLIEEKSYQKY